jgi:hypothetical protein
LVHLSHLKELHLPGMVDGAGRFSSLLGLLVILCCRFGLDLVMREGAFIAFIFSFVILDCSCVASFIVIMSSTPPPPCTIAAGIDACNIVVYFILLLLGSRCFYDLYCAPRPSHIAGNFISKAGCIALSSSLVHLSHLKVLNLWCKFV